MYKFSVPVMLSTLKRANRDEILKQIKEAGAERVFLAMECCIVDEKSQSLFDEIKETAEFFHRENLEVGAWFWTFMPNWENNYIHMTSPSGKVSHEYVCPSDEDYLKVMCEFVKKVALCGVDLMMFDDDFRYGFLDCGLGCVCDNHKRRISEILGEDVSKIDFQKELFTGKGNKYRSAYLQANGYFLERFATSIRETVDSVNPNIRFGLCSCMTTWDFNSSSAVKLSKILAGSTKPFIRLIGAPYWAALNAWENKLQDVIDLEKMEAAWCEGEDIEIFSEGDCYPRPRNFCPSSYVEIFDLALKAEGCTDGILKYMFDYVSKSDYERGYVDAHLNNREKREFIERYFTDKESCGIRVYEDFNKYENCIVPECFEGKDDVQSMFYSHASRLLSANSIPTVYSGDGICGIAFGYNVRIVPEERFHDGIILDITAAQVLQNNGIDTGLIRVKDKFSCKEEHHLISDDYVRAVEGAFVYETEISPKAEIISKVYNKEKSAVCSYYYENALGQKFFIYTFEGYSLCNQLKRQYARTTDINYILSNKFNRTLPVYVYGHPDLYVQCKKSEKGMAIWLSNCFADAVNDAKLILDGRYRIKDHIGCDCKIIDNELVINKIYPFDCVGIDLEKIV